MKKPTYPGQDFSPSGALAEHLLHGMTPPHLIAGREDVFLMTNQGAPIVMFMKHKVAHVA